MKKILCLWLFSQTVFAQNIETDTLSLFDAVRNRVIPVAYFHKKLPRQSIVIFSHGYGQNKGGDYLAYSYLTDSLANAGYFVVSVQHELPMDDLLPKEISLRRPFWERGTENIYSVIQHLKITHPTLNFRRITLIGHSNGGDMTALFPQKYPRIAHKIITLDNRRVALPRMKRVYSLRSSDQPADVGVLPTQAEIRRFKMRIIQLKNTIHNDMDDNAKPHQRSEINRYVLRFLKQN